jgi:hypothetical protein
MCAQFIRLSVYQASLTFDFRAEGGGIGIRFNSRTAFE